MRARNRGEQRGLIAAYTALHEGVAPKEISRVRLPSAPRRLIELGPLSDVVYVKDTPDGRIKYHHPFAKNARPLLVRDERGKLHVLHGSYVVNERGIVDLNKGSSSQMAKRSNLFSFGGSNRSGGKKRGRRPRRNPSALFAGSRANPPSKSADFAMKVAIAGASAAAFEMLTEIALQHMSMFSAWSAAKKQGVQAGAGAILALVGHRYAPTAALGIGIGAVANGVQAILEVTQVRAYLHSLFAPRPSAGIYGQGNVRGLSDGARVGNATGNRSTVGAKAAA